MSAERLMKEFVASDGQPPKRYVVYDYGVGDMVLLGHVVSINRKDDGYLVQSTSSGTLELPGVRKTTIAPGVTLVR